MFYLAERSVGSNADSNPADFAKNVSTKLWAPASGIFFPLAQAWSQSNANPLRGCPRRAGQRRSPLLSAATRTCAAPLFAKIFDPFRKLTFFARNCRVNDSIQPRKAGPISDKYHKKQQLQSANDRTEITPKATEALLYFCR